MPEVGILRPPKRVVSGMKSHGYDLGQFLLPTWRKITKSFNNRGSISELGASGTGGPD